MRMPDGSTPRVTVLCGGPSEEREVSIESGTAVAEALGSRSVPVKLLKIDRNIEPHLQDLKSSCDVVFIALHGSYGEDGTVQQALEDAGLAYTGSGPEASRAGMIKSESKRLFEASGLNTPKYRLMGRSGRTDAKEMLSSAGLQLPVVVKPDASGSSIGVSIVREESALDAALNDALRFGDDAIVEAFVSGRELTVGVVDDRTLPVIELQSKNEFFDYDAKYSDGITEITCPAMLDHEVSEEVSDIALEAFNSIGCRDFGRVDFILDEEGAPQVLEVNTIPGFTSHSLLPCAAKEAGLSFSDLTLKIVELAVERMVARLRLNGRTDA